MKHELSISMDGVTLRPMQSADIEKIRVLRNKNRSRFFYSAELSADQQQAWYQSYLRQAGDFQFSVFYNEIWVGTAAIYHVDGGSAEFGRLMIDREAAGRGGLGVVVTRAACRIAFDQLGLVRLSLEVFSSNTAAVITYLKAGFRVSDFCTAREQEPVLRMERARA